MNVPQQTFDSTDAPTCASCVHFLRMGVGKGICRRFPPQIVVLPQLLKTGPDFKGIPMQPVVSSNDACGEHTLKPKEN